MPDRHATVSFGRLTPGTSGDADGAPDGALVRCSNLRPAAAPDGAAVEYEVVGSPSRLFPGLSGVRWGALHSRQRPETYRDAGDPDVRLEVTERVFLVVVPEVGLPQLRAYDLADAGDVAALPLLTYDLPAGASSSRLSGSLVPMGTKALVVLATQEAAGVAPQPLAALVVGDESVEPLAGMPMPRARITLNSAAASGEPGASPGRYALRACLEFAGGRFGPLGPATFRDVADGNLWLFDVAVEEASWGGMTDAWREAAIGVAVFISYVGRGDNDREPTEMEVASGPWRYVRTVPIDEFAGGVATIDDLEAEADVLAAAQAHEEGDLAYCQLSAATALAFNRRAVLGGAALDYPVLAADVESEGVGATNQRIRIAVEIETINGRLLRYGPVRYGHAASVFAVVGKEDAVAATTYPDRRARRILAYRETAPASDVWALVGEGKMRAPDGTNLAGLFDKDGRMLTLDVPVIAGGEPTVTSADITAANARLDHDPNRVLASDTGSLLTWPAARSVAVGDGAGDGVMALAVVAEAATEGQFGEYPLLALTRRGAWLIRTGTEIAGQEAFFLGVRPVATEGGAAGPAAACLVRGARVSVFASSDDGLVPYDPFPGFDVTREALGGSLGRFAQLLTSGPALACRLGARGPEVWVAGGASGAVLAYNLDARAFFELDLERVGWFESVSTDGAPDRILVGIDGAGRLWREEAGTGILDVSLETGPLGLGMAGERKRLRRGRIHQRPFLSMIYAAVVERVERYNPTALPTDDDTLATTGFVPVLDGAAFRLFSGSVIRPRLVLMGQGQAGQRLQFAEFTYDPRPRAAMGSGTRTD